MISVVLLLLLVKVAVVEGAFHLRSSSSSLRLEPTISTTSLGANVNTNNSDENRNNNDRLISRRKAWETTAKTAAVGFSSSGLLFLPVRNTNEARAAELPQVSPPSPTTTTSNNSMLLPVPKVRLGKSSLEVSRTIQGHWQLAGGHGRYKESEAINNMRAHAAAGITTLDTADIYGPSELIVGKFAKEEEPNAGAAAITVCTKFCCFKFLNVSGCILRTCTGCGNRKLMLS
jgi:hypothetical protein